MPETEQQARKYLGWCIFIYKCLWQMVTNISSVWLFKQLKSCNKQRNLCSSSPALAHSHFRYPE